MKYAIIILILFIHFEIMANQISDFNWEKRIVIVSFEKKARSKLFVNVDQKK